MRFARPFCLRMKVPGQLECNGFKSDLTHLSPILSIFSKSCQSLLQTAHKTIEEEEVIATLSVFVDVGEKLDAIFCYYLQYRQNHELHFSERRFIFFFSH